MTWWLALGGLAAATPSALDEEPAPPADSDSVPAEVQKSEPPWDRMAPESPWGAPPASPPMIPSHAAPELAPWWQVEEAGPWDAPIPSPPTAPVPKPAEEGAPWGLRNDEAGWGNSSDEVGWGDSSDEAGWGDGSDEAGWGDSSDEAGRGDGGDEAGWGAVPSAEAPDGAEPEGWWSTLPLSAGGAVESRQSLWMERLGTTPLASARQSVDLEVRLRQGIVRGRAAMHSEVDFSYLPAREIWDQATTQTYGYQVVPRELYVSVAPGPFELALGRQTVAWGDGMLLSTVDVIAPRDNREPGLADLEDLRLPVTMARLGWYPGSHRLELLYVPEFNHGFRSTPQGPYGFADALVGEAPDLRPSDVFEDPTGGLLGGLIDALAGDQFDQYVDELVASKTYQWNHLQPTWDLSQPQFYGRWKYSGQGFDVALHAASTLDKQGVLSFPGLRTFVEQTNLDLDLDHLRYTVLGHTGTAVKGKTLVRWEAAVDLDRPFNNADFDQQPPDLGIGRGDLATAMVGLQLGHLPNTTIDIEATQGVFLRDPGEILFPVDTTTWAMRLGWSSRRDKVRMNVTGLSWGPDGRYGGLVRADVGYAPRDGLWLTLGGIVYRPGRETGPLIGLDTHDQLFVSARWSF